MIEIKYGKRKVVNYRGARIVVGGLTAKNKIDILLYISKELARSNDENSLYALVMRLIVEIFEVDNMTLRLWDGQYLQPVAFLNHKLAMRRPLKPGEGFSGTVFASGKSTLITDLSKHPEYLDPDEKTRCVVCVPIINESEKLGTLSIEKEISHFYKKDDQEILEALAAQLALAITKVRLITGLVEARQKERKIQQQLEWDLKMGRNVQRQIVQQDILPWNSLSFACHYAPMVEVSGDYFAVHRTKDYLTILLADVSGHGVPAALVTMALHYHFHYCMDRGLGLIDTLEELSEHTRPILPEGVYFTAQLVRIFSDHSYSFVNAGHMKLIHYQSAEQQFRENDTAGIPLGFTRFMRSNFEERSGTMQPGDLLVMLTDGITEQRNPQGQEVQIDRLYGWLQSALVARAQGQASDLESVLQRLMRQWSDFVGTAAQTDDRTLLLAELNPQLPRARQFFDEAKAALELGDYPSAESLATSAHACDESLPTNLLLLTKLAYRRKDWPAAIHYLRRYAETSGAKSAKIFFLIGSFYLRCHDIANAKREFKKALALAPDFTRAHLALANCYLKENAYAKARRALQHAQRILPQEKRIMRALEYVEGRHA
ncbi:MAG: SpoIIE family protein phosphatase [Turneriella sp.]|nr:SpoIIE family protein phosphatase [Turneriella sp.]